VQPSLYESNFPDFQLGPSKRPSADGYLPKQAIDLCIWVGQSRNARSLRHRTHVCGLSRDSPTRCSVGYPFSSFVASFSVCEASFLYCSSFFPVFPEYHHRQLRCSALRIAPTSLSPVVCTVLCLGLHLLSSRVASVLRPFSTYVARSALSNIFLAFFFLSLIPEYHHHQLCCSASRIAQTSLTPVVRSISGPPLLSTQGDGLAIRRGINHDRRNVRRNQKFDRPIFVFDDHVTLLHEVFLDRT
jgi:hypothetical protein